MPNAIYPAFGADALLSLAGAADVRVALLDLAGYTYAPTDAHLSDIPGLAVVAQTPAGLTAKQTEGGVFRAANTTFPAVFGNEAEALVLYIHTGNDATSRLVMYQDTNVVGLPVVPNGGDIIVEWDAVNGIFALLPVP